MSTRAAARPEGYVIEQALSSVQPDEAYFWATHGGAELDLLMLKDGARLGIECKHVDAPRLTPSMRVALKDLALDHLLVVYPARSAIPWPTGWRRCRWRSWPVRGGGHR